MKRNTLTQQNRALDNWEAVSQAANENARIHGANLVRNDPAIWKHLNNWGNQTWGEILNEMMDLYETHPKIFAPMHIKLFKKSLATLSTLGTTHPKVLHNESWKLAMSLREVYNALHIQAQTPSTPTGTAPSGSFGNGLFEY